MLVIVNPAAAGGRLGLQWPRIRALLEKVGIRLAHVFTKEPGHATELAAEAVARGTQEIIVAGGDGTICEVAEGLHRAGGGVLGILPLGTGNDTARTLGIPRKVDRAIAALGSGQVREVDLMQVASRVVVNAAGLGLLGAINAKAASLKKVRGLAAYLAATLLTFLRYREPQVELDSDGFTYKGRMSILSVHNGPTTGGGFCLAPGAVPDDGQLEACLVEQVGMAGRFSRLVAALTGSLHRKPKSHFLRFQGLRLMCQQALEAHLHGNPFVIEPPGTEIRVLPRALRVLVPQEPLSPGSSTVPRG